MGKKELTPKIRFAGFTDPWEQRKVGDYYEFKNGLNKGKEFFGSGTPIVNFTDVFHNRGIETAKLKGRVTLEPSEIKNYEVKKGDLFFTRTSETIEEIGYPSVMLDEPENTVFSGFVLRGRCFLDQDPLDDLFKKYVFFTESFRNEMLKKSSMTTRALTSGTSIKEMVFFHPSSKVEQRKIGELLSQIDNSITLHQRKYEKLQNIKKSMLEKMFPRDGGCIPEVRFAGFTDPWEQRKLGDAVDVCSGKDYKHLDEGEIPVYGTGGYMLSVSEALSQHDAIGIGRKGTIDNPYILIAPFWTVDTLFYCVPKNSDLNFVYALYQTINWRSMDESTGVPSLSKTAINDVDIHIPSVDEQHRIGELFSNLDETITLHQCKHYRRKSGCHNRKSYLFSP